jgi:multicomponent Na+:H+ antiporter subunit D
MTISLLVGLPLLMSLVVLVLRRLRWLATPLTVAVFMALAIGLVTTPQIHSVLILGRIASLAPIAAAGLALSAVLLGLAGLYGHSVHQGVGANALTLAAYGLFAAALSIENLTLAVILIQAGAVLAVLLLPLYRADAAMTALRALFLLVLAGTMLLVGSWAIQQHALEPGQTHLIPIGGLATAMGFAIVIAAAPFYVWQPPALAHGSVLSSILLGVMLQAIGLLRLQQLLVGGAWAASEPLAASLFAFLGIASVAVGSIGAWAQRSVSRIVGYTVLADAGLIMVALGLEGGIGMPSAFLHLIHRGVALAAMSMVAGLLRHELGGDTEQDLIGAWRRIPLTVLILVLGGWALVGLPPTGGFMSRVAIGQLVAQNNPGLAVGLQLAAIGPIWALARCLAATFQPMAAPTPRQQPLVSQLMPLVLVLALLVLGIYPQALQWVPIAWQEIFAISGL